MAAMAWNWSTALMSAGIVCVFVALIAILWHRYIYGVGQIEQYGNPMNREQRRYANDTNTIANCRCECERIEISEYAECYQPAMGCSQCHSQLSPPTVTGTNCRHERPNFEECPCGSETVQQMKCEKCSQPTIGCSECYRRLSRCVCDEPQRQFVYYPCYPDPQVEGFGTDFAAMLDVRDNRWTPRSTIRSLANNDTIPPVYGLQDGFNQRLKKVIANQPVQRQEEGDIERVDVEIEECKLALGVLDDADLKPRYWSILPTNAKNSKNNQSKVQYWSDRLNDYRNDEKHHVQKFNVDNEVEGASAFHSQTQWKREQPKRATVQECTERSIKFERIQERPHDLEPANAEIAGFRRALGELHGKYMRHTGSSTHRRAKDLEVTNVAVEEYRETLPELPVEAEKMGNQINQSVQRQEDGDDKRGNTVGSRDAQSHSPELECAARDKLPSKEIQRDETYAHWEDRLANYRKKKKRPKVADRDLQSVY